MPLNLPKNTAEERRIYSRALYYYKYKQVRRNESTTVRSVVSDKSQTSEATVVVEQSNTGTRIGKYSSEEAQD